VADTRRGSSTRGHDVSTPACVCVAIDATHRSRPRSPAHSLLSPASLHAAPSRRHGCRSHCRALHRHHLAPACSILRRASLTHPLARALLCVAGGSKARPYFAFHHLDIAGAPPSSLPRHGQRIWMLSFPSGSIPGSPQLVDGWV
jgi:hypothetical protein